jgi:hypothetical protein
MNWLRVLLFPLRIAPLLLLLLAALLLALIGPPSLGLGLVALPAWGMVGWVTLRYGMVLLRCQADGVTEPPALAIEMANPFQSLPYPPALPYLLRAPQALGALWLQLALMWCACAAAIYGLALAGDAVLRLLRYGIVIYCWWLASVSLGAAMYHRRQALGYGPTHSPEREAELRGEEYERQRKRMLDDLYQQIRMQRYRSGAETLNRWLAGIGPGVIEVDLRHVFQQLCQWGDAYALQRLTAILVSYLLQQRLGSVALEFIVMAERHSAAFRPATLAESRALAELARRTGQQRLAERLEGGLP